ncbi:MAG: sigma-54 dependent transcriptional regulator [Planctomycetota bacterium]
MPKVIVIDDDRFVHRLIEKTVGSEELQVICAAKGEEGLSSIQEERPDVVLLDVVLPDGSGLEYFQRIKEIDSKLPVIFVTGDSASETAIEAMKLGAYDYLLKPLDVATVEILVERALEIRRLMLVPVGLSDSELEIDLSQADNDVDHLIGRSPQMQEVYKAIGRVAAQDVTTLILGESGTGKELVARAIYQHGKRSDGPFLAVNCAALPDALLESELFGHEKGAFTGADRQRIGKFEQCSGGTIFLDEVGDMSLLVQAKVLRLLQEQRFERVGGNQTIQTDVRVIAATNRDLEAMSTEGEFRTDLFYRLNGYTISLPPLRDREEDLEVLLEHFRKRLSRQLSKKIDSISPDAMAILRQYSWPGNIRELQSVLRQAILRTTGSVIVPEFLPASVLGVDESGGSGVVRSSAPRGKSESDFEHFLNERLIEQVVGLHADATNWMERQLLTGILTFSQRESVQGFADSQSTRGEPAKQDSCPWHHHQSQHSPGR